MNKFWLIFFLAAMTILTGCKKDEVFDYTDPDEYESGVYDLKVNARINRFSTKSNLSSGGITVNWSESDKIAVFMQHGGEAAQLETYNVEKSSINNVSHSADFKGALKWKTAKSRHDFYAFTPAVTGQTLDPSSLPISVPVNQSQVGKSTDHINDLDVMVASPLILSSPLLIDDLSNNEPLNFVFDHVFVMHEFRFMAVGRATKIKIEKITYTDANGRALTTQGGKIDLTQYASTDTYAKIEGGTESNSIELNVNMDAGQFIPTTLNPNSTSDPSSLTPVNVFAARLMALPGDFTPATEGDNNIKVSVEIGVYDINDVLEGRKIVAIEYDGKSYHRGKRYTSTFVLTKEGTSEGIGDPGEAWDGTTATKPTVINAAIKTLEISEANHLAWIAGVVNGTIDITGDADVTNKTFAGYTITMTENINLGMKQWTPIGLSTLTLFSGTFDGSEKYITGLSIIRTEVDYGETYIGLFGAVKTAVIKNLNVIGNFNLTSTLTGVVAGGIVGYNPSMTSPSPGTKTEITNCTFSGEIDVKTIKSGTFVGGIFGNSASIGITIDNCINYANINAINEHAMHTFFTYVGGVAGGNHVNISNSMNLGNITGSVGSTRLGGVFGFSNHDNATIEACINYGALSASGPHSTVGGVVAYSAKGQIRSSYNRGELTLNGVEYAGAYHGIGGVAGCTGTAYIVGCYNIGAISSDLEDKTGNIAGGFKASTSQPNYTRIENNYFSNAALPSDLLEELAPQKGAVMFSATDWPVSTDNGWSLGSGAGAPWIDLGEFAGDYPTLWWE